MPKKKVAALDGETFGQRLARFRKAAGFTQRELAAELGTSQRMIAYYEGQTEHPPTKLVPLLCEALRVSADELLGVEAVAKTKRPPDGRMWRRFEQVQQLPAAQRRQVAQLIDAFLDRERLRRKVREDKDRPRAEA